jgi:hypothetical protein
MRDQFLRQGADSMRREESSRGHVAVLVRLQRVMARCLVYVPWDPYGQTAGPDKGHRLSTSC